MSMVKLLKRILKRALGLSSHAPYVYDPSHTVIKDYSDFSGISVNEIQRRINSYKSLTKKEWDAIPASGFKGKAELFYASSSYYICDILAANVSKDFLRKKLDDISPKILTAIQ